MRAAQFVSHAVRPDVRNLAGHLVAREHRNAGVVVGGMVDVLSVRAHEDFGATVEGIREARKILNERQFPRGNIPFTHRDPILVTNVNMFPVGAEGEISHLGVHVFAPADHLDETQLAGQRVACEDDYRIVTRGIRHVDVPAIRG